MKYVIGIDIGGTNLRIGMVDAEGRLTNFERKSSASLVAENAVQNLGRELKSYIERYEIEGQVGAVSVGVPSIVSKDKSFIYSTPNLKGLENIDLGNLLKAYVNVPVFVDRDVNYLLVMILRPIIWIRKKSGRFLASIWERALEMLFTSTDSFMRARMVWRESLDIFRCTVLKKPVPAEISAVRRPAVPEDI